MIILKSLVLSSVLAAILVDQLAERSMSAGAVYCVSQSAIVEHLQATAEADTERVGSILKDRRICDYAQEPVTLVVLESPPGVRWAKVRIVDRTGEWRKGSRVMLPKNGTVYVRRSTIR